MQTQSSTSPAYAVPPPFSPPSSHRSSADLPKLSAMDLDAIRPDHERTTRAASVLSGMSIEDMEAAEALNALQQSTSRRSPQQNSKQAPPVHVHTTTTYDASQPEPLLRLFTSQYPLAGSLLNGSLTAYKTTQSFIPGAQWTERNVGLPIAGTVARISGVEGGLRWALQPRQDGKASGPRTPDVEKGIDGVRQSQESLPAYNDGDRSPPYTEREVMLLQPSQQHPPPGWGQQLVISTSGLGVAMSDESLRSLRFCLSWLRWANGRLGEAIQNLKALLDRYGDSASSPMSVAAMTDINDQRQAAMAARIAALRKDVLDTLKKVVGIVSQYAGGALPENARNLVQTHLTSLPQRFSIANNAMNRSGEENSNEATASAGRVMVLAQEGLDMMTQVSRVVNDTLVSAEGWCERLGRKNGQQSQQQQHLVAADEKMATDAHDQGNNSNTTARQEGVAAAAAVTGPDVDVKMEM